MRFIRTRPACSIFGILLISGIAPSSSFSQPPTMNTREEMQRIISANLVSSFSDKSKMPENAYYQFIFREIITSQPNYLTTDDWRLIRSLPSHADASLTEYTVDSLTGICEASAQIHSEDDALDLAVRHDSERRNNDEFLEEHYRKFIPQLSEETQRMVQARKVELSNSNQLVYSTVSMTGVASTSPTTFTTMLRTACEGLAESLPTMEFRHETMATEEIISAPLQINSTDDRGE